MKYNNLKLRQLLAAEYVLGLLRGRARRRFERLLRADAGLRTEVTYWEVRFSEFAAQISPVAPPPAVWLNLQHRVQAGNNKVVPLRRPVAGQEAPAPQAAPLWRIIAGLAAALIVVAVIVSGQRGARQAPPAVATAPAPPPTPTAAATAYVALLKLPEATMQWTLSLTPERGEINVAASGEYAQLGEHSLELWVVTATGPVSVGLLPVSGVGHLKLPAELATGETVMLAVTLEPVGGAPNGKPTGPVLTSGTAIKVG
jgi:anti-sigma-K factor RskA